MRNIRIIKCAVAAHNSNGEADLYFVKVSATEDQINDGRHYDAARQAAENAGYEISTVVFDEDESAGRALLPLFNWDAAALATVQIIEA